MSFPSVALLLGRSLRELRGHHPVQEAKTTLEKRRWKKFLWQKVALQVLEGK